MNVWRERRGGVNLLPITVKRASVSNMLNHCRQATNWSREKNALLAFDVLKVKVHVPVFTKGF